MVEGTASKVKGKKLIVCNLNRAVKWWDKDVKEAIRVRERVPREIHIEQHHSRTADLSLRG